MLREEDFPQEATEENIQDLIALGRRIEEAKPELFRREPRRRFVILSGIAKGIFLISFEIFAFFLWLGTIWLFVNLGAFSEQLGVYWALFLVIITTLVIAYFVANLCRLTLHVIAPWLIRRIFSAFGRIIPPLEYDIFSHSCAVAENIQRRDRREAQNASYFFRRDIREYFRRNRDLRYVVSQEIETINKNIRALAFDRVILFSEEHEMPLLLMNLSLALLHQDFPRMYSLITDLGYSLNQWKIEKPRAKIKSFIDFIEEYPKFSYLVFIFALILIFFILYQAGVISYIPIPLG